MDHEDVRKLIDLIKDTDITEILIEKDGAKIKIKRERFGYPVEPPPIKPPVPEKKEEEKEEKKKDLVTITSPIVGIFHRSPSPEAPPYVEVGSVVKKGQVLCIVEAMKLMNEIESDTDGVVVEILVENGQPVEYGQPLFLIEPTK
jgi:acetyl-CoA carboxylase biotin carboxyl carrier protein